MNNEDLLKYVGVRLRIKRAIVSLASGLESDKQLDIKIAKEVAKQIKNK